MAIEYDMTIGDLAPRDFNIASQSTAAPTIPTPSGSGWRLQHVTIGPKSIYYIWVRGNEAVFVDATLGNVVITLPALGPRVTIKKVDGSANTVTIQDSQGRTIDGQASIVINTQWDSRDLRLNDAGTDWYLI